MKGISISNYVHFAFDYSLLNMCLKAYFNGSFGIQYPGSTEVLNKSSTDFHGARLTLQVFCYSQKQLAFIIRLDFTESQRFPEDLPTEETDGPVRGEE